MKDFSIVIAHRGNPMGLWATVHSIDSDLEGSGYDYDFSIYVNGEKDKRPHPDTKVLFHFMTQAGRLGWEGFSQAPLAPPTARHVAAQHVDGKYLFFFDNHCLVKPGYFSAALKTFEQGADMVHSVTRYYSPEAEKPLFEYKLTLEKNFWAEAVPTPVDPERPYRILAGGHGGFAVRHDVWDEVGGYWDGFEGYGGEEMYFDLKMALLGKTNYLVPKMVHYHYAGQRPYKRHYTDEFYKNMLCCANIIGGKDWMNKVYGSFSKKFPKMMTGKTLFDILMEADKHSSEHAAWLASKRLMTLDELLLTSRQHVSF